VAHVLGAGQDAAYSSFDKNILGSITTNKQADMAVLDTDPFTVSPDSLKDIVVWMTVMNGNIVYSN
jgi:predicted amidohydrolase YtcJ